jgi:hypothetical protein
MLAQLEADALIGKLEESVKRMVAQSHAIGGGGGHALVGGGSQSQATEGLYISRGTMRV